MLVKKESEVFMNMLVNGMMIDFTADEEHLCLLCEIIYHQTQIHHAQQTIVECSARMVVLFELMAAVCPVLMPSVTRIYE